jgi:predicted fused transcriptional regulator/phosphomethylpyrimidine kinase
MNNSLKKQIEKSINANSLQDFESGAYDIIYELGNKGFEPNQIREYFNDRIAELFFE